MWRVLEDLASREARLAHHDLSTLVERADDQLSRVETLRVETLRIAAAHAAFEQPRPRTRDTSLRSKTRPALGIAGAGYSSGVAAMFTIYLVLIVAGIVLYATVGIAHL